tara:strand:- start:683 stop:1927 length:1245 start_codon:yes stop_codon:yes gene_type:complete
MTDRFGLPVTTGLERPEKPILTPAQTAYLAAQIDPTVMTGLVDVTGGYPEFPSRDVPLSRAFSGEPMPSLAENVREGNLGIAALQALGAIPGIGAITRGRRVARAASDAARASRGITASESVNKMGVIAEFAEKHPTAFNRLFTRGKKKISRSKFESGDPSAVERVYLRVRQKQGAMQAYAEEAERAARQSRRTLFWPKQEDLESDLERLGYRAEIKTDPVTGEVWRGSSWSYNPTSGGSSISNYYVHPDTGKTVRVSDHAPVWPRSNRDVMIHPGSFDSYDDLVTSLERSSRATRTKETARIPALSVREIVAEAESKGVKLDVSENKGVLNLSRIVVPEKNQGVGTAIMKDISDYADRTGQTITLTPSKDFGGSSVSRLKDFYRRFGFVENKGKNKNFEYRDTMYRSPDVRTK